jgi:hypothetical protein
LAPVAPTGGRFRKVALLANRSALMLQPPMPSAQPDFAHDLRPKLQRCGGLAPASARKIGPNVDRAIDGTPPVGVALLAGLARARD